MIYMDHAATTAVSDKALQEIIRCSKNDFGNPSAIYSAGQTARNDLERARAQIADSIGALRSEIYFTSGGTESDNWVLRGIARKKKKGHLITTAIEHNAVLRTAEMLEEDGFAVTYLQPDNCGRISPEQLEAAIRPDTILISIMTANNVVGTIQDITALVKIARAHHILFHTDAVQAVGHMELNVRKLGVDFLSLTAHKFRGPKGVGALFCRLPYNLPPLLTGGGQERSRRSGTENVPGIAGMAAALKECTEELSKSIPYLTELRDHLIENLIKIPGVYLTGDPVNRLPGLASFAVEGIFHSVLIVNALADEGICVSSGSACSAASKEASHVLQAMGYNKQLSSGALRFSLDMENTREEVDRVIGLMPGIIAKCRAESLKGMI